MNYLIASDARKSLYKLIDKIAVEHEPAIISGKRNKAVLVSIEDWENIEETLLVASNKKLSDSIIKGLNTPFENCLTELD